MLSMYIIYKIMSKINERGFTDKVNNEELRYELTQLIKLKFKDECNDIKMQDTITIKIQK